MKRNYNTGEFDILRITRSDGSFFEVVPALGAMVRRIGLSDGAGSIVEILKSDSDGELAANPWFRGRILFPFNDRIPDGVYSWRGREYRLTPNDDSDGSAIHGLVFNRPFAEKECRLSENSAEVLFSCSLPAGEFPAYPFTVALEVRYRLDSDGFAAEYLIGNRGDESCPVALGWHPYFTLSGSVNNWQLRCPGGRVVAVDNGLIPTGEFLPVKGTELDFSRLKEVGALDLDIAFTAPPDGEILLQDETHRLTLRYDRDFFPFVQIFIPPDRQSIAIEPVTAATNSFNMEKLGRLDLTGGEERRGSVRISLNRC